MKRLNFLLGILIGLTILSCSSDDGNNTDDDGNNPNPPDQTIIAYKKANVHEVHNNTTYISTQEVFYNSDKNVEKVVTNIDNGWRTTTLDVTYNGNTITKVAQTIDYGDPNSTDTMLEFDVTISNGQIVLTESTGVDYEIQIDFTGDYVDSFKEVQPSTMTVLSEDIFQRNSDNNIVSHVVTDNDMTYTYSNYDIGNVMPFYREYSFDYFIVFDLKPSEKLALTEIVTFSSGNSETFTIDPAELTYDTNNNIIRHGDATNYTEYEYIEL